jgi:hypothetical protein
LAGTNSPTTGPCSPLATSPSPGANWPSNACWTFTTTWGPRSNRASVPGWSSPPPANFVRLSPALRLVSGEAGDLGQLAKLLGEPPQPERDSRATLYLIAPNARLLAFFPASQAAQAVAADLNLLAAWPLDALENLAHE